jgi:hypothetical protein
MYNENQTSVRRIELDVLAPVPALSVGLPLYFSLSFCFWVHSFADFQSRLKGIQAEIVQTFFGPDIV